MAEQTWLLQDTPIFWFTGAAAPPTVRLGGYTSYDLALTVPDIGAQVPPEVEARMRAGDQRFLHGGGIG